MKEKQMDIQLKQNEIEAAVRRYVAETIGVNLTGKRLGVQFSMTRGAGGLIANLSIEDVSDVQIPGYTDRDADPVVTTDAPKLASVTRLAGDLQVEGNITAGGDVAAGAKPNTIGAAIAEAKPAAAPEVAAATEVAEEIIEAAPAKADSGLFNDD